jgi:hypothetical protein
MKTLQKTLDIIQSVLSILCLLVTLIQSLV